MGLQGLILLLSFLGLFLLSVLIKFLHKVWWTPIRIQNLMREQGIKGPSYKFIHGSTKEAFKMRKEMAESTMELFDHHMFRRIQPHIYSWTKIYGKCYLSWYGSQAEMVVTEPELVKEILNNKDGNYPKPDMPGYHKKLLGEGIVSSNGEKWSKLRKLANFAFHVENLKNMTPAMITSVEMMLQRWKDSESKEIEIFNEFTQLTSDVISRTAFGSSYLEGKNIFEMLSKLSTISSRNVFQIRIPVFSKIFKTADDIEAERLDKGIRDCVIAIIKKRKEQIMSGGVDSFGNDFLGLLLKANRESDESKRITIDDMVNECKTFYIAGQETTNILLTWTVFLLALYTDWQEKARKEVLEVFGHQSPHSDGIARLKTVTMIVNESLRLYPPALSLLRQVNKTVQLGKLTLPAGLKLNTPILALHHDPQIWGDDAQVFKPERFSEGIAKATKNNIAAFVPFGSGPRICVGFNFATTEAKAALAMILQRYSFTLSPGYVHSPLQYLTIRPQHGIQILLQPLQASD